MIGALELDGRFARAGHAVAYLVVTLPVTLLGIPAVLLLILGAAPAGRSGARCTCSRTARCGGPPPT